MIVAVCLDRQSSLGTRAVCDARAGVHDGRRIQLHHDAFAVLGEHVASMLDMLANANLDGVVSDVWPDTDDIHPLLEQQIHVPLNRGLNPVESLAAALDAPNFEPRGIRQQPLNRSSMSRDVTSEQEHRQAMVKLVREEARLVLLLQELPNRGRQAVTNLDPSREVRHLVIGERHIPVRRREAVIPERAADIVLA